jgi:hypothetical protein
MPWFMGAILATGIARFILTLGGLPNDLVKYASMTAVIATGALFFAIILRTHRERLYAAYLLILPYVIVEIAALGYTWASGRITIFQSPEYSLNYSADRHMIVHLLSGISVEPLVLFLVMEGIRGLYAVVSPLFRKLP